MQLLPLQRRVKIKHSSGLHIRPAATIVQHLSRYQALIFFSCRGQTVSAKSIIHLLSLTAGEQTDIIIHAEGIDAEEAVDSLLLLLGDFFEEVIDDPSL